MAAVLAPWPFLDGGATAVVVEVVFDGATVEETLLWRGGARAVALAEGTLEVRACGGGGYELIVARAMEGEVEVGTRAVELRELSLCGVRAVPIGPRTRVTVRAGLTTYVIAGTTAPRRLPLGPAGSWRRRAVVAVAAMGAAVFGMAMRAAEPRVPSWAVADSVRVKVALMLPGVKGGRAATTDGERLGARERAKAREAAAARAKAASAKTASARAAARAEAAAQSASAKAAVTATAAVNAELAASLEQSVSNQGRKTAEADATAEASAKSAAQANASAQASAAAPSGERVPNQDLAEDARRAAAMQARQAGVVGLLAHSRAAFLGDLHVVAAEVTDRGAVAMGAGDEATSGAAAGASGGMSGGMSGGGGRGATAAGGPSGAGAESGNGSGSGTGSGMGTLEGSDVGEAYGVGGLGLEGVGEGGGGAGDGTIGLGSIGTVGFDGGSGYGVGYGSGCGGLGSHRATVPEMMPGLASVRGACDADLIRRVVRAHVNEVRFCYEQALQSRPELAGRVVSQFAIGFDGRVSGARASATGVGDGVAACVARAIARWQFTPRCVGAVTYPFTFVPADGAVATRGVP